MNFISLAFSFFQNKTEFVFHVFGVFVGSIGEDSDSDFFHGWLCFFQGKKTLLMGDDNGNPIAVCSQSHFSGTEIYTAVKVDTSHYLRMIFISLIGGGGG